MVKRCAQPQAARGSPGLSLWFLSLWLCRKDSDLWHSAQEVWKMSSWVWHLRFACGLSSSSQFSRLFFPKPHWGTASSSDEEQLSQQRLVSNFQPFSGSTLTIAYYCISTYKMYQVNDVNASLLALFSKVFLAAATWDLLFRSAALSWCACPEA